MRPCGGTCFWERFTVKIKSVSIKNFRSFKDQTVHFDDYTSLVGQNGAGKSNVLHALNVFFRETEGVTTDMNRLEADDFHGQDTSEPIEITVTFGDLSNEAQEDFSHYYRQGELIVTAKAEFEQADSLAVVKQYGQRRGFVRFKKFFEMHKKNASATDLKIEYAAITKDFPDIDPAAKTKDNMKDALQKYEAERPEKCALIPSEEQFYGATKGGRLNKYIQWIYVPAVKDVTKEGVEAKNTALGKILYRTVRRKVNFDDQIEDIKKDVREQYRALLAKHENVLKNLSISLTSRVKEWAHPGTAAKLRWAEDFEKSVRIEGPAAQLFASEGTYESGIARFGHGLQRSFLLALLQELADTNESEEEDNAPALILGCEEPELYQHPPQARHLATVMEGLGGNNAQVIVSTHSPYFVTGENFQSLRMVRRNDETKESDVSSVTFDEISARIAEVMEDQPMSTDAQRARLHQALEPQLNEMFFTSKIILVEGLEDSAYITAWLVLSGGLEKFRRHGAHIVPASGKGNIIRPLAIANELNIPVFVVFDSDGNEQDNGNRTYNKALLRLLGGDPDAPFPEETVWDDRFVQWPSDIKNALKAEVPDWDEVYSEAAQALGSSAGSLKKNPIHIGNHIKLLHEKNMVPESLRRLCIEILRFVSGEPGESA